MTDKPGEEGGFTVPVASRQPEAAPVPPPVEILGHASRSGQPADPAPPAFEIARTNSVGIPAAPPANGPGARFTPPAPPARHLSPYINPRSMAAPAAPTLTGAPSRPMPPRQEAPSRPEPPAVPGYGRLLNPATPNGPGRPLPPATGNGAGRAISPAIGGERPGPAPSGPARSWSPAVDDRNGSTSPPARATGLGSALAPHAPVGLPPSEQQLRGGPPPATLPAPGGAHPGNGATAWRPLPEPALASPPRPAPTRTVGRLASLAPDPEPRAAMRPAPAPPRTAQDFSPERVMGPDRVRPAARGWRRVVRSASMGAIAPGPGRAERRERELVATAIMPIATCRRVAIVSRKGGIGKTTTTLMLGHTFAEHRRDRVVALDANPDAGSLAYRIRRETEATVTQLLRASDRIRRYSDMRTFTSQASTRLEILASDDDPTISVALGEPEYRQVLHVLEHHYNLILMDTGTGILDSATQGILRMADQIVVCAAPGIDASRASSLTLDWLDEHGYHDLVSDAVVVINQVRKDRGRELRSVADHFAKRCRAVVKVPWDPHLAEGLEVEVDDLRPETRAAYLTAVAAVARSFALPSRHR